MLTFPTFISFCCVFWIACQRSAATKFPPNGDAIQPPPKSVGIHNNLPAGSPFSPADHRIASGSDAGSAATPSGPEGAPRNTPATELSPDIVALIKLSVDQAAKNAFEAGMQYNVF